MFNSPLKAITSLEPVAGFKCDLAVQPSTALQLVGSWQFNKLHSGFAFQTVATQDAMNPDASFLAGTYHDTGKLESKGSFNIGYGFKIGTELGYRNSDPSQCIYSVEAGKDFSTCYFGAKYGNAMMGWNFMQTIYKNCCAGFEYSYMVC